MTDSLRSKNIIGLLGIGALDEERKVEIVRELGETVERRLIRRIARTIGEAEARRLEELAAAGDPEALAEAVRKAVPDFETMLLEEIDLLKREAAVIASAARQELEE